MATLDEIGAALEKADALGNVDDARELAKYYSEMKAQQAQQTQEELPDRSIADYAKDIATTGAKSVLGADQTVVGAANLVSKGKASKFLEEHGVDFNKMQKQLSDPEYEYFSPQHHQAVRVSIIK